MSDFEDQRALRTLLLGGYGLTEEDWQQLRELADWKLGRCIRISIADGEEIDQGPHEDVWDASGVHTWIYREVTLITRRLKPEPTNVEKAQEASSSINDMIRRSQLNAINPWRWDR